MSAQILELVEIFSDLSPAHLELIYGICKEETYNQGQIIFEENTPSKEIFIILDGIVDIVVNPNAWEDSIITGEEAKQTRKITSMVWGQSFGEIALVDQGLRSATAVCGSETCRLLVISREDFMALMKDHLDLGFQVMSNLAADLCLKIRQTTFMMREKLMYSPVPSKDNNQSQAVEPPETDTQDHSEIQEG